MRVIWHPQAEDALDQVANYVREQFGAKRRNFFLQEVRKTTKILQHSPYIGSIDPLFDDRPVTYRSIIINGLSKMVYYIDDNIIHIAAFWDTRREPKKQSEQVK